MTHSLITTLNSCFVKYASVKRHVILFYSTVLYVVVKETFFTKMVLSIEEER